MLACKLWNMRATDIMQGVVFGTRIDEMGNDERLLTRLDFDQAFGTAINRYCCQAVIGHPLDCLWSRAANERVFATSRLHAVLNIGTRESTTSRRIPSLNQFEETYNVAGISTQGSESSLRTRLAGRGLQRRESA